MVFFKGNQLKFFGDSGNLIFTTREYAHYLGIGISSASRQLYQLKKSKTLLLITRNIWANPSLPEFSPLLAVPHLLGKAQGYVSFLTTLSMYGVISQIPQVYQVATVTHTRTLETPIGIFEFHQLKSSFMRYGVLWSKGYRIAEPEKALVDTIYLSMRKKKRFSSLPELNLDRSLVKKKMVEQYIQMITPMPLRIAVQKRIKVLFSQYR